MIHFFSRQQSRHFCWSCFNIMETLLPISLLLVFQLFPISLLLVFQLFHASNAIIYDDSYGLIAAFGDFNSDKLTDVFVIDEEPNRLNDRSEIRWTFHVIKQTEHKPYFVKYKKQISCYSTEKIVSLIPGDFHGNTWMDLVVVTKVDDYFHTYLVRGNQTNLSCSMLHHSKVKFKSKVQPLMLDINGDSVSDLLAEKDGQPMVWLGSMNESLSKPTEFPGEKPTKFPGDKPLVNRANAFIDINGDGVADIILHTNSTIEYWFANHDSTYGQVHPPVPFPKKCKIIGESTFVDIDSDHTIEHLLPVVRDGFSQILMLNKTDRVSWIPLKIIPPQNSSLNSTLSLNFTEILTKNGIEISPMLRAGDFDSDGYTDFVATMKDTNSSEAKIVFLMNQAGSSGLREFKMVPILNPSLNVTVASFLDVEEDGKLDLIYSHLNGTNLTIDIIRNSEEDTNFLKILVASSKCPMGKCWKEEWTGSRYRVNYGTNQPGPFIQYLLTDPGGYDRKSCGGQLAQSSHFSLQTPYLVFGLGRQANYIRKINVTLPYNGGGRRMREIEEVVPDAQIILIPEPYDKPNQWKIKLFIYPSDIIYKTLYTLLGMCVGLILVILFLHRREQLADTAENKIFRQHYLPGGGR